MGAKRTWPEANEHRMGYSFTVNGPKNKFLPGRPDIILQKHKTLFVHGCFQGEVLLIKNT